MENIYRANVERLFASFLRKLQSHKRNSELVTVYCKTYAYRMTSSTTTETWIRICLGFQFNIIRKGSVVGSICLSNSSINCLLAVFRMKSPVYFILFCIACDVERTQVSKWIKGMQLLAFYSVRQKTLFCVKENAFGKKIGSYENLQFLRNATLFGLLILV